MTSTTSHAHSGPILTPAGGNGHGIGPARHGHIHVTSPMLLLTIYGMLLVLTVITVAVTAFDFGDLNVWVALGIAVAKASIVALYFMHLRWDSPFNGAILIFAFIFVAIFIGVSVLDSHGYQPFFHVPAPGTTP
jgi:cytochrome c oxidase subunit 4